ncbi:MAG: hypothetical protein WCO69_00160 [Candidatus Omnitrophota bacterium]
MTAIMMAAIFVALPVTMSFAQAEKAKVENKAAVEIIKGEVVSVDVAKGEVVIKDEAGADKTLTLANKEQLAALKAGDKVKARVKAGTTVAESISKAGKKKAHKSK